MIFLVGSAVAAVVSWGFATADGGKDLEASVMTDKGRAERRAKDGK